MFDISLYGFVRSFNMDQIRAAAKLTAKTLGAAELSVRELGDHSALDGLLDLDTTISGIRSNRQSIKDFTSTLDIADADYDIPWVNSNPSEMFQPQPKRQKTGGMPFSVHEIDEEDDELFEGF